MQTFKVANPSINAVKESANRICYILYPVSSLNEWIQSAAQKFGISLVMITGMDWDDDLTPWPARGVPSGSPDFKGNAPRFLSTLTKEVIPEIEQRMGIASSVERTLLGVSLSGLFTLWEWMIDNTFHNIISLSGSFWYDGFVKWLKSQPIPKKTGKAYFLLGNQEAKTKIKAFQPVQVNTEEIVGYLHDNGINDYFELVPGNHYQYAEQRLIRALTWMFNTSILSD